MIRRPPRSTLFPTRRSSDLLWGRGPFVCPVRGRREHKEQIEASTRAVYPGSGRDGRVKPYSCLVCIEQRTCGCRRSEEHTSELQSHVNLVCRLLLEKKKILT